MKRLFFIGLAIVLSVNFAYPKAKKKLTERQAEIVQFEKEQRILLKRIIEYEDVIQNIRYIIHQLAGKIEYLKEKEKESKKAKTKKKK